MGYRSNVTTLVYGPEDEMIAFIAGQRLKARCPLAEDEKYVTLSRLPRTEVEPPWLVLKAEFESVKWYPNYPDVDMWAQLLTDAGDIGENGRIGYEFMRVGEEVDDIEYDVGTNCEYWLGVSREIVCDAPTGKPVNQGETQ